MICRLSSQASSIARYLSVRCRPALLLALLSPGIEAADLNIGLLKHASENLLYTEEWRWALRGGGAQIKALDHSELVSLDSHTPLLIVDNTPLHESATAALEKWVHQGGLLIYAGAHAALQGIDQQGKISKSREFALSKLLGANFAGFDPGLTGSYPAVVETSPLLSPLQEGDALRLGVEGIGHHVSVEASDGRILARSAMLSPGPDGIVSRTSTPTILSRRHGKGHVMFLTFSPAQIALCYPDADNDHQARDCTGASQAHALMRWLTANLLWEERKLQIPLLWEAPGDRPHAVVVTGDVHHNSFEVKASAKMAKILDELELPSSLYIIGKIAGSYPEAFSTLQNFKDLEISPHSADGMVYWKKRFQFTGALGILYDFKKAQELLSVPDYPSHRDWLISVRNESWQSDRSAWWAMGREGVGLVFDHIADTIKNRGLYLAPRVWFDGGEHQRIFVPLFEKSIATPVDNFRLQGESIQNIASLSSAQPEPCCIPLSYPAYTQYIERWHSLFNRLATAGGLTEVWLWHPGGVAVKGGFEHMRKTLLAMKKEPDVSILRGDVVATWRYNRELYPVQAERDEQRTISAITLSPATGEPRHLPPNAPELAKSTSYWVLGQLEVPGWGSRQWIDPAGRTVTVLVHPLPGKQEK